jgi:hypothetical protein
MSVGERTHRELAVEVDTAKRKEASTTGKGV